MYAAHDELVILDSRALGEDVVGLAGGADALDSIADHCADAGANESRAKRFALVARVGHLRRGSGAASKLCVVHTGREVGYAPRGAVR
jgi:hypothetical protein